jgi:DNA-directed RNA polymerase specialized sigma24 family protein
MLRRYFVEGQSVQGIADALGVPRGSVTMWTAGRSRPHLYREFVGG